VYNRLSVNAQMIVDLVREYPGSYFKLPLIQEIKLMGNISTSDSIDTFNKARASGLIRPEPLIKGKTGTTDSGPYTLVNGSEEILEYAQDLNNP
jgi:hypothetical protein